MMTLLDQLVSHVKTLPPAKLRAGMDEADRVIAGRLWTPNLGRQTQAYFSLADILLYGGQAGGGKSQLVVGWGANESNNGIIFRRELSQTDGLERDGKTIIANVASFNGQDLEWTWPDGKTLKLGGMKMPDDWISHAGRERDYIGVDEGGEFLEVQIASIQAWLRAPKGKRARMIIASNPPRTAEGLWLLEWFGPWLDDRHPLYPAFPGALLWAIYVTQEKVSRMIWVDGPGEYEHDGETYTARSLTFVPASLEDNPYRDTPEYRATLQSLPEPLRSQLLHGDWRAGMEDAANQTIPTSWVRAAIDRRKSSTPPQDLPMCAIGVDCSGGGSDPMVQAARYDGWYADFIITPAKQIPLDKAGAYAAGLVLATRRDGALVVPDMGGGYGGPLYEHLRDNEIECFPFRGAEGTTKRSKDGNLKFVNSRSAAYWLFREALDPGQPGGSPIQLPISARMLAGLTAPSFEVTPRGIKVEPKVIRDAKGKVTGGVMAKLGFSPDEADAVVMAWFEGPKQITHAMEWMEQGWKKRRHQTNLVPRSRELLSRRRSLNG